MSRQQDYIDSVNGNAHQSAVTIIAELESELEQCLDCCKRVGELEAERDAAFNKGMERAAEIVESNNDEDLPYLIRQEIDK